MPLIVVGQVNDKVCDIKMVAEGKWYKFLLYLVFICMIWDSFEWHGSNLCLLVCIIVLLIEVWKVCIIGYDCQGANSFRMVCIIIRNLRLLLINFLVVESEWVDTFIAEPSPYPGWSFCHSGLIFELWSFCHKLVMSILLFNVDNVWLFLSLSAYRVGNWFGLSCTWAGEFV